MSKYPFIIAVLPCWTLLVLPLCAFFSGVIAAGAILFFGVIRPAAKRGMVSQDTTDRQSSPDAAISVSADTPYPCLKGMKLKGVGKLAEVKLEQSEATLYKRDEQFRAIFEQSEIGINLADPSGRLIWVNSAFCTLVNYTREELLQKTYMDLTHPSDRDPETGLTEQLLENDIETYSLEKRYVCKDGRLKWVNVHVTQVKDEDDETVLCSAIAEDISDRKQAEEALRQSEERFRVIFEQAAVGIVEADLTGAYLKVNRWFCEFIGYQADELLTMSFQQVTHPDDLAISFQHGKQLFAGDRPSFSLEKRFIRKDGEMLWANVSVSLVTKSDGSPDYTIAVIEDITKRKQAQAALEQSEREMTAMFNSMTDVVFMLNKQGQYLKSATASNHLLRQPVEKFVGKTIYDVFEPEKAEMLLGIVHEALAAKSTIQREYSLDIQGRKVWFSTHVSPISEDSVVWVARDISHHKRSEETLKRQAERDRALNEVTRAIRCSLNPKTLFATAVYEFANLLQAHQVVLLQYVSARQEWDQIAFYEFDATQVDTNDRSIAAEVKRLEANSDLLEHLEQGEIVCLNHNGKVAYGFNQALPDAFVGERLVIPIHLKQLWGCLSLTKSQARVMWQKSEVELVSAITDQLAIAIQQAELYQQVQNLNAHLEQQVQERTAVLQKAFDFEAMLKRITDKVRDSLDENQILQTAVNELGVCLEVECCNAANYSSDLRSNQITHEYFTHKPLGLGKETILSESPTPEIFDQLLQGQYLQFCFSIEASIAHTQEFYAVLACPLLDDQGVLGDLWLFKQKHESFNDLEVRVVQQVANQCAIALRQSRLYQAAQAQVQELERLNHLKDDFLSTVSHELRTPMSNIKMSIQMLEISMQRLGLLNEENDRLTHYLRILQEECQRETNLINDLLNLSRLDSGREPLTVTCLQLQYWLPHLIEVFAERMQNAQQRLILEICEDLPPLETDFNDLEKVFMELIHNACKYTSAGECIQIKARLLESLHQEQGAIAAQTQSTQALLSHGSFVEISVANSGIEIPHKELNHVFEKFYRVPNHDPWKHGGTGLGLALVKKRVERLEGTISVTSRNNWTTFTVRLPHKP